MCLIDHAHLALTAHLPLAAPSSVPAHPVPTDTPLPGQVDGKLGIFMGWALRLGYVACFLGFIWAAVKMINGHRHGEDVNFKGLGMVAAACMIIGSAGAITDFIIS